MELRKRFIRETERYKAEAVLKRMEIEDPEKRGKVMELITAEAERQSTGKGRPKKELLRDIVEVLGKRLGSKFLNEYTAIEIK